MVKNPILIVKLHTLLFGLIVPHYRLFGDEQVFTNHENFRTLRCVVFAGTMLDVDWRVLLNKFAPAVFFIHVWKNWSTHASIDYQFMHCAFCVGLYTAGTVWFVENAVSATFGAKPLRTKSKLQYSGWVYIYHLVLHPCFCLKMTPNSCKTVQQGFWMWSERT